MPRPAVCEQCGKHFMVRRPSLLGRFCSQQCSGLFRRNPGGVYFYKDPGRWIIRGQDGSRTYYYRAVAEAKLGRELTRDEVVHHIDGDRMNDDPANLEVMTRADHCRLHHQQGDIPGIGEWNERKKAG